ncbi:uncharacterized protein LOC126669623 [Mercurialis annua]|uniref:uncharacterized protein LOC126669623 n=1 Tax=Mercurialis annua TaxID=3986 RepID=UPI00215F69F7|nr:uncharacterized protein LOC126669623 [Mercurialis annua]
MLKIRPLIASIFYYKLGNGSKFFFWGDPWVNGQSITYRFPGIDIKGSDIKKYVKVCSLWRNDTWVLPDLLDDVTNDAWDYIRANIKIRSNIEDQVCSRARADGKFNISSVWRKLVPERDRVQWGKIIWSSGNIPRYSFITWMALIGRLVTKDKLRKWNVINDDKCSLCNVNLESRDHLFFDCSYSKKIWRSVLDRLGINRRTMSESSACCELVSALLNIFLLFLVILPKTNKALNIHNVQSISNKALRHHYHETEIRTTWDIKFLATGVGPPFMESFLQNQNRLPASTRIRIGFWPPTESEQASGLLQNQNTLPASYKITTGFRPPPDS